MPTDLNNTGLRTIILKQQIVQACAQQLLVDDEFLQ